MRLSYVRMPDVEFFPQALGFRIGNYGMTRWSDLFTPRQLVALTTLSDLVSEVRERVERDALAAGLPKDAKLLGRGGTDALAYAGTVATYIAFTVSKLADLNNSLVTWKIDAQCPVHLFARQAIPITWDYPEANPFSGSSG